MNQTIAREDDDWTSGFEQRGTTIVDLESQQLLRCAKTALPLNSPPPISFPVLTCRWLNQGLGGRWQWCRVGEMVVVTHEEVEVWHCGRHNCLWRTPYTNAAVVYGCLGSTYTAWPVSTCIALSILLHNIS